GVFVVYTRTNDTALKLVESNTRKRSDMFSRGKIINDANADAVVSIHANYFPSEVRRGAQAFFERKDAESFRLATAVQDALNVLNLENTKRTYSSLTAEKYILACSPSPSIIVECGFLSNPQDEKLLQDADYLVLLARAIAEGIFAFFDMDTVD
ncbi:MAG: N-acetylmuramoyl-L-alanine amidase, partial [Clostridia bacterium]|nr:N-acetylmuramoyl-L-alanine amidase [Clostridia bacterium]